MNLDPNADPGASRRPSAEVAEVARAVEDAIRQLARMTVDRSSMTPADVDVVLVSLASGIAALRQATAQLSDILDQARNDYVLSTDDLTESTDPDFTLDTARLHLDAVRQPAVEIYRHLDAAHQQTARLSATDHAHVHREDGESYYPQAIVRPRLEDRQPPTTHRLGQSRGPAR